MNCYADIIYGSLMNDSTFVFYNETCGRYIDLGGGYDIVRYSVGNPLYLYLNESKIWTNGSTQNDTILNVEEIWLSS
jgi:hypothetical protein